MKNTLKIGIVALFVASTGLTAFYLMQISQMSQAIMVAAAAPAHGASGGHGAPAAGGGHGAPAPEGGGHGAPPAEGGGHGGGGGGGGGGQVTIMGLDEVFANVNAGQGENRRMHILGVKLELELFEPEGKELLETKMAGVKDAVITTAIEQDYDWLNTVAGKLFFKEALVARVNHYFKRPLVRDIHFTSYYVQ